MSSDQRSDSHAANGAMPNYSVAPNILNRVLNLSSSKFDINTSFPRRRESRNVPEIPDSRLRGNDKVLASSYNLELLNLCDDAPRTQIRCCIKRLRIWLTIPAARYTRDVRISVIIPAINEAQILSQAAASAWAAGANEVIVVDGASVDNTVEVARSHRCQVLTSPPGRAAQQNVGAREATGDVLLFLHADNWLSGEALSQLRTAFSQGQHVGGAFQQEIEAAGVGYRLLERGNAARARWLGLPYGDQGIFVRREVFHDVGGFPSVRLMEDLLFMKKLRRTNWPILLPGPLHVSARRWRRRGIIRQTARNWALLTAYKLGCPPDRLAKYYIRHAD